MASGNGSGESLRELNRLRVVDALRRSGRLSRADLARETGLSRSTISALVASLVQSGYVIEDSEPVTKPLTQGRPPVFLRLDASAGLVAGIDFDHDHVRVAVSDLSREIIGEAVHEMDVDNQARPSIAAAAQLLDELLSKAGLDRSRILGVGVAMACPVSEDEHAPLHPGTILPAWEGIDPRAELGDLLGMRIHLENDSNLGALAEVTLGAGRNASEAVYVQMSAGIGAGIISGGLPFRGSGGFAGELGHIVVDQSGPVCRCGNRGCLETLASGSALTSESGLSIPELIEKARGGDEASRQAIEDAGRATGRVLGGLCNAFNPEMVVIGGELSRAGDMLLDPLREELERYSLPMAAQGVEVVAGELGERAFVLGALALAIAQSEDAVAARIAAT